MTTHYSTAVLIVGGGLVGLSSGLFLHHLDVPFILVEKNEHVSPLPRARGIHTRTMELFRQVGVEDAVMAIAATAWKQGGFGGARRGRTMLDAPPIMDVSAIRDKLFAMRTKLDGADPSPSTFVACPQTLIEPVLRQQLEARGGDVRFGHELVTCMDTGDAMVATVRGPDGQDMVIDAAWLIGADGGRGFISRRVGIKTIDTPARQYLLNIFFSADLAQAVQGRTFSQCEIANEKVHGLFLSMNNADLWSFHLEYDPAHGPPTESELPDLLRAAIGLDNIAIDIRSYGTWNTGVRVAEHYRSGRTFLCGDAAHLMPPWGGFNATTGIADAHNLAWKLAAVLRGEAAPALLDSYEAERQPLAVQNGHQALLRTDFDARFGIETETNRVFFPQVIDAGALLLRYRYTRADASPESSTPDSVAQLHGQTGTRFPHAWILRNGQQISTLDLFGSNYVVLAGPQASVSVSSPSGLKPDAPATYVAGKHFTFVDGESTWHTLTNLPDDGQLLVRPDGFVWSRSDES